MSSRSPSTNVWTLRRSTNGGSTTTSTAAKCSSLRLNAIFWVSAIASRWFMFIFQLPAISGFRAKLRLLEHGDAGQGLALEVLERRATAGGDVPERVFRQAELAHRSRRVAATHDGEPRSGRHGLGDALGACRERRHLEDAHRAVPEHGLRVCEVRSERGDRAWTDVEALHVLRDGIG